MAPLPPENTRRFWVEYTDEVNVHELMVRLDTDATVADGITVVNDFFTALDPALYQITITGARFAEAGSTISNPVTWDGDPTFGTGFMPAVNGPREFAWEARSADGRKASYSVYGMQLSTPADYRYGAGEQADLDAARSVLVAAHNAGTLCTISGAKGIFKLYVNVNFNSYWERAARF